MSGYVGDGHSFEYDPADRSAAISRLRREAADHRESADTYDRLGTYPGHAASHSREADKIERRISKIERTGIDPGQAWA